MSKDNFRKEEALWRSMLLKVQELKPVEDLITTLETK
jgi:hypothetical protein